MAKIIMWVGFLLMAAPFALTAFEIAYAKSTGATGETAAQAGTFGFYLGILTLIPGFILFVLGWISSRE